MKTTDGRTSRGPARRRPHDRRASRPAGQATIERGTRAPAKLEESQPPAPSDSVRIVSCRRGVASDEKTADDLERLVLDKDTAVWVDLTEPSRETVDAIAKKLGLHPLIAEDIIESNERAKVELVGDQIHIVMFALERASSASATQIDEVDFVLGKGYLLSVHPRSWDPHSAHQMKQGAGELLQRGADFVLWALVDGIVDGYFPIFDQYADEIDELEDAVVGTPDSATLQHLFRMKRDLIRLRHVITPTREIFAQLTSREFEAIGEEQVFYFRDVYDHLIRLTDEFDAFRDLVTGALELYLSTINNNLSRIMKRLTGVTVVLAGVGAVGGIFGMSEATTSIAGKEGFGFYFVTVATICLAAIAAYVLHRIDWL